MANRKANKDKANRGEPDEYDRDLERDSHRHAAGAQDEGPTAPQEQMHVGFDRAPLAQKDRTSQAQSPVEENLDQPPKKREGH